MGGRTHRTLIVAALLTAATAAAAQNPTPARSAGAAPDTLTPELIFSDVFSGRPAVAPRVSLRKGVVYRIETEPAAEVSVRSARHPSLPPLMMVPLSREALPGGDFAGLIVPRSDDEYRLDLVSSTDEPVRIRIWRDPKESSRFARIQAEGFRAPILAVEIRAVYLASFRDAHSSRQDSVFGDNTTPQSAYGVEGCLAVLPNGRILPDRIGGCALTFALWYRGAGRNFYSLGIAPEYVVRKTATSTLSLSPQLAFGNTRGGRPRADYTFIGIGARYTAPFPFDPAAGYQLEATILDIRSLPSALDPSRVSTLTLRLGAGFTLKL